MRSSISQPLHIGPALGPTRTFRVGALSLPFIYVPTGMFWMGAVPDGVPVEPDAPPHLVRLVHPLWVARAPLTEAEAAQIGGHIARRRRTKSSAFFRGSWYDGVALSNRASVHAGRAPALELGSSALLAVRWLADGFRMLTEAEWEYTMRGAMSEAGAKGFECPVSIGEWVLDGYDHDGYPHGADGRIVTNPARRLDCGRRVVRGGDVWERHHLDAAETLPLVRICCRAPRRAELSS